MNKGSRTLILTRVGEWPADIRAVRTLRDSSYFFSVANLDCIVHETVSDQFWYLGTGDWDGHEDISKFMTSHISLLWSTMSRSHYTSSRDVPWMHDNLKLFTGDHGGESESAVLLTSTLSSQNTATLQILLSWPGVRSQRAYSTLR